MWLAAGEWDDLRVRASDSGVKLERGVVNEILTGHLRLPV